MTITDEVADFIRTAMPPTAALDHAAVELGSFDDARLAGGTARVVRALAQLTNDADQCVWASWIAGAAAASGGSDVAWIAVCAAVTPHPDRGLAVEATAIGYEIADRVAASLGESHSAAGWSVQATAGSLGAAAAVGRLLALNFGQLRHMLGICATQAAGLTVAEGTDAGPLQIGKAAADAVEAALLSRTGFTSSAQPLEGRRGLFALMSDAPAESLMTDRLGQAWAYAKEAVR
jgi:2-methylcitrate dehydratase PrpD